MISEKESACASSAATNLVEGLDWDQTTIAAAVKVIDVLQALVLPWITKLSPKLGAYAEVILQTIEDLLRKMMVAQG